MIYILVISYILLEINEVIQITIRSYKIENLTNDKRICGSIDLEKLEQKLENMKKIIN